MKMLKLSLFTLSLFLFVWIFFTQPVQVFASICDGPPYNPACVIEYVPWIHTVCGYITVAGYPVWSCTEVTTITTRCTIPQSGGGSCQCCYKDGCYLDCAVIKPTGNSGPNDPPADPNADPPADPTADPRGAGASCGDLTCDAGETCSSCVGDCGACPTGTIQARAVQVIAADTSCTAIRAVPTTAGQINNTILQFTRSSASAPPAQIQSGANYVTFANILVGWYTVDSVLPTIDWMYSRACWNNLTTGTTGEGLSQTLGANQTIAWDIGYTLGTAWLQTQGGDVYASGNIRSFIPSAIPRVFMKDGTGGYPGILTYGTSYDLDSSLSSNGSTLVSSKNWQVHATQAVVDYYDYFYRRFGAPTVTDNDLFPNILSVESVAKPASRAKPYYISGDMTTAGNWTVTAGENIIFIVTGNVTIGGKINITGDGFVAFIVKGNIIVSSSVGVIAGSTTSVLDGMYIVSPTGTFQTGLTTAAASARFVGKGMFIAGNFLLQRDLELVSANTASSAELFIYDPQLLFTLPDSMKDTSVSWQEVAP